MLWIHKNWAWILHQGYYFIHESVARVCKSIPNTFLHYNRYQYLFEKDCPATEAEKGDWAAGRPVYHQNSQHLQKLCYLLQNRSRVWGVHKGTGQQAHQGEDWCCKRTTQRCLYEAWNVLTSFFCSHSDYSLSGFFLPVFRLRSRQWHGRGINKSVSRLERRRTEAGLTGSKATSSIW